MMRMFSLEELKKIDEQYHKIYSPFIETDFFSLLYDNSEEEWCYVIDENITTFQLIKARGYFLKLLWMLFGKEMVDMKVKPFGIR